MDGYSGEAFGGDSACAMASHPVLMGRMGL